MTICRNSMQMHFVNALFDVDHKENPDAKIRMMLESTSTNNWEKGQMEELTLEKFEQASEIVKQVTQETKLIKSSIFQRTDRK